MRGWPPEGDRGNPDSCSERGAVAPAKPMDKLAGRIYLLPRRLVLVRFVSPIPAVFLAPMPMEKVHQRAGQQNQVWHGLGDVSEVLRKQVVDPCRARNEHENAQGRAPPRR